MFIPNFILYLTKKRSLRLVLGKIFIDIGTYARHLKAPLDYLLNTIAVSIIVAGI